MLFIIMTTFFMLLSKDASLRVHAAVINGDLDVIKKETHLFPSSMLLYVKDKVNL